MFALSDEERSQLSSLARSSVLPIAIRCPRERRALVGRGGGQFRDRQAASMDQSSSREVALALLNIALPAHMTNGIAAGRAPLKMNKVPYYSSAPRPVSRRRGPIGPCAGRPRLAGSRNPPCIGFSRHSGCSAIVRAALSYRPIPLRREGTRYRWSLSESADHAVVLCVDEKSQIQALNWTQRVLPMGLGYIEGITHDYVCHGTTTLFAALDIAAGAVFTECKSRHQHQQCLSFLTVHYTPLILNG